MTARLNAILDTIRSRLSVDVPAIPIRRKGVTLLAAVAVLLLVLDILVLAPMLGEVRELSESISMQERLADRYAAKMEEVEKRMTALESQEERLADLATYAGQDMSVERLATELDASLSRIAPDRLRKVRYRPRQEEHSGNMTIASFEYELVGDIHGLAALLDGLRDFNAPLMVREMCVKATPKRERPLDIRLQLGVISSMDDTPRP